MNNPAVSGLHMIALLPLKNNYSDETIMCYNKPTGMNKFAAHDRFITFEKQLF